MSHRPIKLVDRNLEKLYQLAVVALHDEIHALLNTAPTKANLVVALPGGTSLVPLYQSIIQSEFLHKIPWARLHFFLLDERIVPINADESNYKLQYESLFQVLLNQNLITQKQIHPFVLQPHMPIKKQIDNYSSELLSISSSLDIILAGVGEDGHLASLFPSDPASSLSSGHTDGPYAWINNAPKWPPQRLTATFNMIRKCSVLMLFFVGANKATAYQLFNQQNQNLNLCPAHIAYEVSKTIVITDRSNE